MSESNLKPSDQAVHLAGEPILDLEAESLALLREITGQLEGVVRLCRSLLDAVDQRNKAA